MSIPDLYYTKYTKLRVPDDLVHWRHDAREYRWINIEAEHWLYDNAKGEWDLTHNWPMTYYILFADSKDAIMWILKWL